MGTILIQSIVSTLNYDSMTKKVMKVTQLWQDSKLKLLTHVLFCLFVVALLSRCLVVISLTDPGAGCSKGELLKMQEASNSNLKKTLKLTRCTRLLPPPVYVSYKDW